MNLSEAIEKARLCEGNPPPNESCTCDWVIVPILHSLGYDHFDIVSRGADNQNQFPDYTILKGTSCEWFLEAKAWSVHLADNHAGQALNYANQNGRRWVVLSNGKEWRLYDNDIRGTSAEKLVAMARLSNDEEIRPFLDSISKDSVTSGRLEVQAQGFRLASTLNAQMKDADSDVVKAIAKALRSKGLSVKTGDVVGWFAGRAVELVTPPDPKPDKDDREDDTPDPLRNGERKSLAEWNQVGQESLRFRKPTALQFHEGNVVNIATWRDGGIEIVRLIASSGQIPPLPWRSGQTCILAASKRDFGHERPSITPVVTGKSTVYVDIGFNSSTHLKHWVDLCKDSKVDPERIFITIGPKE